MKYLNILTSMLFMHACCILSLQAQSWHELFDYAKKKFQKGKIQEAIIKFQNVLAQNPKHGDTYFYLGKAFFQLNCYDNAIYYYQKAANLSPNDAHIQHNLGLVYLKQENQEKAMAHLECAVGLNRSNIEARYQLAQLYKQKNQTSYAIAHFTEILNFQPENVDVQFELGMLLKENEQFDEAIKHLATASELNPNNHQIFFHLGSTLLCIGQINQAILAYKHVLELQPYALAAEYNTGYALKTAGKIDEAIEVYNDVLKKDPNNQPARLALGFAYLQKGDYQNGWEKHSWYLKHARKNADALRALLAKSDLAGKKILLNPEGGLGDTINFLRYAQTLKKMGATIIAMIQKPLVPLLSSCPYIDQLLAPGDLMPTYDAASTFMSLPAVFNSDEQTIPREIPYIYPDQSLVSQWKNYLQHDQNIKIGITWQADVFNDSSRLPIARRGIPFSLFFYLKEIPGLSFYSLQKKEGLEQLVDLPDDFKLHIFDSFDEEHGPFMDTAAIMQNLDLIITIDSAVAHLAGALGKPVWLLLPYAADWRWLIGRTDSPWYPTMRIFKQIEPFNWVTVMRDVYQALQEYVKMRS